MYLFLCAKRIQTALLNNTLLFPTVHCEIVFIVAELNMILLDSASLHVFVR